MSATAKIGAVTREGTGRAWAPAALACMGIVFGDIGTSPLYTLNVAAKAGTITPAISVLSAIEGVKVYAPQMGHAVVPLTVAILAALFFIQRNGTSWIGGIFGPVMLIWFVVAGVLGVVGIARTPSVLAALSPLPAIAYLWHAGPLALVVIGGAFLAVTGGEAFYADMGHFGPLPIRMAWFGVALPALTLNYFGQGGLLLADPSVIDSPFYQLAPQWAHYPLVVLATVATVIASQSIISGAYSLTQQAINLGFLPRMNVIHTEGREIGQIYIPFVNWALAAGTLAAVLGFGSSDALAGAYGIAVSLLMAITTLMATFVALHWKHNPLIVYPANGSLLALDLLFFASTTTKLLDGGWFPLLIALVIAFLMLTWRKGEAVMDAVRLEVRERSSEFIEHLKRDPPLRIPGTAIVLGRMAKGVPLALSHNVKCNHVLHENVLLVAVTTTETPRVSEDDRVVVAPIAEGVTRIDLRFGFMEQPNVPEGLVLAAIYYTGHETIIPSGRRPDLPRWREALFAFMHHNAQRPGAYFKIPGAQIMEIGIEFEI